MTKIVELLDEVKLLVDVGCDHAYASIEAVKNKKAGSVLACDIRKGPLMQAENNIKNAGLEDQIKTFLSDGIRAVIKNDYKPDGMIIAGMGGKLMLDILKAVPTDGKVDKNQKATTKKAVELLRNMKAIVLSPQSEPDLVRHFLIDEVKIDIYDEYNIYDEGKYYTLIKLRPAENAVCRSDEYEHEALYKYGLISAIKAEDTFIEGLLLSKKRYEEALEKCKSSNAANVYEKLTELEKKINEIDFILNYKVNQL
ncbi:MAG: tRNA (adenine(22)-N(1))-methyltransferase TrmK [Eubacteriales bacterium]|nr:tRNA (adenine(22)-N(1))-methyltransferase TrmK [Eubacteriales bacterium]